MRLIITSLLLIAAPTLALAEPQMPQSSGAVSSQPARWGGSCQEDIHNLRRENRRLHEELHRLRHREVVDNRALIVDQCNRYSEVMPCIRLALKEGIRGEIIGSCYRYSDSMKCLEIVQVASERNGIDISDLQVDACYNTSEELNCLRILGDLPTR